MKTWTKCLIAALCLSTAVFFGLWQAEKRGRSDMILLVQANATACADGFEDYLDTGSGAMYWSAVADFRAFEQAYLALTESAAANYPSVMKSTPDWSFTRMFRYGMPKKFSSSCGALRRMSKTPPVLSKCPPYDTPSKNKP